ncbi:DUF4423 domain-containing protein [Bdellovibrio sp. BCCA]|uniref:DUF4423 domain-containing protein n=1 Tax=Bdellovibrio sp. BCCA TaxID=3136281 RepID=UPI0030F0A81F
MEFSDFLKEHHERRKLRNPQYSLRAFARDLGVSSGRLTDYLSGNTIPSEITLQKLSSSLALSSLEMESVRELLEKQKYMSRGQGFDRQLTEEEFKQVSDWRCWSILSLFKSSEFQPEISWIAQKTKFSVREVEEHIRNLENAGLVKQTEYGYVRTNQRVTTSNDVPSQAIRQAHKQFLKIAESAMDNVPVDKRDMTSMTMCISLENLPKAKSLIAEFRAKLSELLESGHATEIYNLNVALFPVLPQDSYENE